MLVVNEQGSLFISDHLFDLVAVEFHRHVEIDLTTHLLGIGFKVWVIGAQLVTKHRNKIRKISNLHNFTYLLKKFRNSVHILLPIVFLRLS